MSKKTKRQVRKTSGVAASAASSTAPASSTGFSFTSSRSYEREFNPDYSFVVKDLRRIGMLAGSFFLILVVLSFFLR